MPFRIDTPVTVTVLRISWHNRKLVDLLRVITATMTHSRIDDRLLRVYLRDRHEQCPRCNYDLCNLTGDRCPECGDQFCLSVRLVEPKLAAFITGLVGLACSLGFSGLFILFGVLMSLYFNDWLPFNVWAYLLTSLIISGLLLGLWISQASWVRSCQTRNRWLLACLCWLLPAGNVVVLSIMAILSTI